MEKPKWWVEPLTKNIHHGCLNCGGTEKRLPMRTRLHDDWYIQKDDEVYECGRIPNNEPFQTAWGKLPTMITVEKKAKKDPDHDWRAIFFMGLRGGTYQRHGNSKWILIESNQGYA